MEVAFFLTASRGSVVLTKIYSFIQFILKQHWEEEIRDANWIMWVYSIHSRKPCATPLSKRVKEVYCWHTKRRGRLVSHNDEKYVSGKLTFTSLRKGSKLRNCTLNSHIKTWNFEVIMWYWAIQPAILKLTSVVEGNGVCLYYFYYVYLFKKRGEISHLFIVDPLLQRSFLFVTERNFSSHLRPSTL